MFYFLFYFHYENRTIHLKIEQATTIKIEQTAVTPGALRPESPTCAPRTEEYRKETGSWQNNKSVTIVTETTITRRTPSLSAAYSR